MHHMGIPLNHHEVCHLYGSNLCDAAQIVPAQVHEHEVLRPLLGVLEKLVCKAAVFLFRLPPGARARNGTKRRYAVFQSHHRLG